MDERRYERLVSSLEGQAARKPGIYRLKAITVGAFAYILLLLLLGMMAAAAWEVTAYVQAPDQSFPGITLLLLLPAILTLSLLLARMLTLRLTPSYGSEITVADAPKLFKILRHVRRRLGGPPIHHVVINADFKVAIEQMPRFGFFGAYRNHLVIGLPMAFALSGKELMALVAHEYAHLSSRPGKLNGWIHRQRRNFGALMQHCEKRMRDGWVNGLLHILLKTFAPYYNAVTFILSRRHEYEADTAATTIVGRSRVVSGMVRKALVQRWLAESFWPKLYVQAESHEKPLFMPYSAMPTALKAGGRELRNIAWLKDAWQQDSGRQDTHPCLRERVEAQAGYGKLPGSVRQTAADVLLGPLARELASRFDEQWWGVEGIAWRRRYRQRQDERRRLAALDGQGAEHLSDRELDEYGQLLFAADRCDDAQRVLERLLSAPGESYLKPTLLYGKVLLQKNDRSGLGYLETVLKLAPSLAEECLEAGCKWLFVQQGEAPAKDWFDAMQQHLEEATA